MESKRRGSELLPRWIIGGLLVVLSFLAFNPSVKAAVTGKIAGVVVDAGTGEPLPGANVIVEGTDMGAATDADGYFIILNILPDIYNIQARMMGYGNVTQTGIEVDADHTTRIKFNLKTAVVEGEGVVVRGEVEVIKMDISSSSISARGDELEAVPFVNDVFDYIDLQAGVNNWQVRGGSIDEGSFMSDGLTLVDNRTNEPMFLPNMSMVKELNIVKGGFNAEYGNVRSGMVNIITKSPGATYNGTARFEFSPAHLKHRGPSRFDTLSWFVRSYVLEQDSLCWLGTNSLPDSIRNEYRSFPTGWFGQALLDTFTEISPAERRYAEALRDQFMWEHNLMGSDALALDDYDGPARVREYGKVPDWNVDVGFGGPIIGDKLGFYASYRQNREAWALPVSGYSDYYKEQNAFLKFTSHLTQSIKIDVDMSSGEINTISQVVNGDGTESNLDTEAGRFRDNNEGGVGGYYLWSGDAAFNADVGYDPEHAYTPVGLSPYDIYYNMGGIALNHALSSNTFYTVRFTYLKNERECHALDDLPQRDPTTYLFDRIIDTIVYPDTTFVVERVVEVTEEPWGWSLPLDETVGDGAIIGGRVSGTYDTSWVKTYNFKADFTSQINRYNEIKVGMEYNYDILNTYYTEIRWESPHENWTCDWEARPIRGGAYLQDKIEWEGIVANIGVRADWFDPNIEWFELGTYSQYFTQEQKTQLEEEAPRVPVEGHLVLSPRVGISHPIGENAKLYFSYGDFYSMPKAYDLFQIWYDATSRPLGFLGNPEIKMPRTTAYELGTDIAIAEMFRLHIAGYYRDTKDEAYLVTYEGYDQLVRYGTVENNAYEDIRGFEVRLSKDFGDWIRGFVNYDYRATSDGHIDRETIYEDPVKQQTQGAADPVPDVALARPILSANIQLITPSRFGPALGDISLGIRYEWEAGEYETWDPLWADAGRDQLVDNLQWKAYKNVLLRLQKSLKVSGVDIYVYGQVNNLFDWKYLNHEGDYCFEGGDLAAGDKGNYLKSLHLPLYNEEPYASDAEYTGGNDQLGDIKSDDKPYIDMPNIEDLTFRNPRSFVFGVGFNF